MGTDAGNTSTLALAPGSRLKPPGRPSIYTAELADRICRTVGSGWTLRAVAREEWAPHHDTIYEWQRRYPSFSDALAHARRAAAAILAEDVLSIADDVDPEGPSGSARVSKARERIGARRWLAGCLDRATYGDALKVDASVKVTLDVNLSALLPTSTPTAAEIVVPVIGTSQGAPTLGTGSPG